MKFIDGNIYQKWLQQYSLTQHLFTWTHISYLFYILSNMSSYTGIVKCNTKGHNNAGQNQM